jgi:hypothetical protein
MTANPNYSSADYVLTSSAYGTARAQRILGIGGFNRDALVLEAKQAMYQAFPLKKGQSYANLAVDFKRTFILVYDETMVTVSADVVGYQPDVKEGELQPIFGSIMDRALLTEGLGENQLQDTVRTFEAGVMKKFILVNQEDRNFFLVQSAENGRMEIKKVLRSELYFPKPIKETPLGFSVGKKVSMAGNASSVWIIEGLGETQALLIREKDGQIEYRRTAYHNLRSAGD